MDMKLKILYVEDDPIVSHSVANTLKLLDFIELDTASDGLEGLSLCNENSNYDMVISDIRMPRLSGLEMLRGIKDENLNPYTIIVSAFNEKDYLLEAIDLDVSKYLIKPLDLEKLVNIIREYYQKQLSDQEYKQQKEILHLNAKLISLGEMIDSIAHQWMQPLTSITLQLSFIDYQINESKFDKRVVAEALDDMIQTCVHLSETLNEFRDYVRPDKKKVEFSGNDSLKKTLKLMSHTIKTNELHINVIEDGDFPLFGYPNQFIHIFINLINNSKDAFLERSIEKREIEIVISKDKIVFGDNAGGIPESILPNIFEANTTSKEQGNGSGIGMYLAQNIALNNKVKIEAINTEKGAKFVIKRAE